MRILTYLNLILIILFAIAFYLVKSERDDVHVFFYNQKVFEQFAGTRELENKLRIATERDQELTDSLTILMKNGKLTMGDFQFRVDEIRARQEHLNARYTADIWKFINDGVQEYGREKGVEFILGASGNGSLMYADEKRDVTAEVIEFLNRKYNPIPGK